MPGRSTCSDTTCEQCSCNAFVYIAAYSPFNLCTLGTVHVAHVCIVVTTLISLLLLFHFLQTVTCMELGSIVTTEDNSFLVWGSRPIIKSPLSKFLSQNTSRSSTTSELKSKLESGATVAGKNGVLTKERSSSLRRVENDVFDDEILPRVGSAIFLPTSSELETSFQSISSGHLASSETTPERKPPSSDNLVSMSNKTPPKDPSNESLSQSNPKSISGMASDSKEQLRRYSSLNLSDTPHKMYPCSSSKDYVDKVNSVLQKEMGIHTELERNRGVVSPVVRHRDALGSAKGDQPTNLKANKRINSSELVMMDGIIMRPTSIDLVGRSGLLSALSVQGLMNAKLEGVSCFGCNVLILIEAQVLLDMEGKEGAQQRGSMVSKLMKQPRLILGRKLTEKGVLRK